jgi:hypothetical protein
MPIKPIDLQTLFVQLNLVGKQQAAEKDGALLHSTLHGALVKRMEDEAAKSVQKPQDDQAAAKSVLNEPGGKHGGPGSEKKKEGEDREDDDTETITDPALGGHIDISG